MNKPCPDCGGKVIPHLKKNNERLYVCQECGIIIAREDPSNLQSDHEAELDK